MGADDLPQLASRLRGMAKIGPDRERLSGLHNGIGDLLSRLRMHADTLGVSERPVEQWLTAGPGRANERRPLREALRRHRPAQAGTPTWAAPTS